MALKLKDILKSNDNKTLNESFIGDLITLLYGKKMNHIVKQVAADPELKKGMEKILNDIDNFKEFLDKNQDKINSFIKK